MVIYGCCPCLCSCFRGEIPKGKECYISAAWGYLLAARCLLCFFCFQTVIGLRQILLPVRYEYGSTTSLFIVVVSVGGTT